MLQTFPKLRVETGCCMVGAVRRLHEKNRLLTTILQILCVWLESIATFFFCLRYPPATITRTNLI